MDARIRSWQVTAQGEGRLAPDDSRWQAERAFRRGDVPAVRRFTRAFGARAGLVSTRLSDFVLAVSEAAACATSRGPCTAWVRLWVTGRRAFCEVRGDGLLVRRPAHQALPSGRADEEDALRRLLLRRLVGHVSVASGPNDGVRVLLSMPVA